VIRVLFSFYEETPFPVKKPVGLGGIQIEEVFSF
jgi:hypothetical protein